MKDYILASEEQITNYIFASFNKIFCVFLKDAVYENA
jgi:hypothetical protein